jgi:hypothetical protein
MLPRGFRVGFSPRVAMPRRLFMVHRGEILYNGQRNPVRPVQADFRSTSV